MKKIKKNLWVIYACEKGGNTLLSILPGRIGSSKIKGYVEQMWIDRYLTFEEQVFHLNRRKQLPYRAEFANYTDAPFVGRIICGYEGADIYAVKAYAFTEKSESIVINYRMPSEFDRDKLCIIDWKEFTEEIKKT